MALTTFGFIRGAPTQCTASDSDNVDGLVYVACTLASGSTLPLGDTRVEYSVRDTVAGDLSPGISKVSVTVKTKGFSQPVDKNALYKKEKKVGNTVSFKLNVYGSTETKDTAIVDYIQ